MQEPLDRSTPWLVAGTFDNPALQQDSPTLCGQQGPAEELGLVRTAVRCLHVIDKMWQMLQRLSQGNGNAMLHTASAV